MIITYIFHSCFAIELDNDTLIFDYYKDDFNILAPIMDRSKNIYILSSHAHIDHFNAEIFQWSNRYDNIHYVLSNDIHRKIKKLLLPKKVHFIKEGEHINCNNIEISAFGSTDVGVSFMVKIAGKNIFHAGDLNNWHWRDESTDEEILVAEKAFVSKLKAIKACFTEIDLAMFPVDSRLGSDYAKGAYQFVHDFKVKYFIPMHFWDEPDKACDFNSYRNQNYGEYICLKNEGDSVTIIKKSIIV